MFWDRERLYEVPFDFAREQMESQVVRDRFPPLNLVIGQRASFVIVCHYVSRNERGARKGGAYQSNRGLSILVWVLSTLAPMFVGPLTVSRWYRHCMALDTTSRG